MDSKAETVWEDKHMDNANGENHHNHDNGNDRHNRREGHDGLRRLCRYGNQSLYLHLISALMLIAILAILTGCGEVARKTIAVPESQAQSYAAAPPHVPTEQVTPPVSTGTPTAPVVTATAAGTAEPISTMQATFIAHATDIAEYREALATEVALTAAPTDTPGAPPIEPSATPMLGMLPGCGNANPHEPQTISCWRGVLNGELVDVGAGSEGSDGDVSQGIILVHTHGQDEDDIYQTPQRVGAVEIGSVSTITHTLFTLSTTVQPTPQEFVFDLTTRQWVP